MMMLFGSGIQSQNVITTINSKKDTVSNIMSLPKNDVKAFRKRFISLQKDSTLLLFCKEEIIVNKLQIDNLKKQIVNKDSIENDYKQIVDRQKEYNKKVTKLNLDLSEQLDSSKQKEKRMFKTGVGAGVSLILIPEIIL